MGKPYTCDKHGSVTRITARGTVWLTYCPICDLAQMTHERDMLLEELGMMKAEKELREQDDDQG